MWYTKTNTIVPWRRPEQSCPRSSLQKTNRTPKPIWKKKNIMAIWLQKQYDADAQKTNPRGYAIFI